MKLSRAFVVVVVLSLFGAGVDAAIVEFEWCETGGTEIDLRVGETADLCVSVTLEPGNEMGFFLYVLKEANLQGVDQPLAPVAYQDPLEDRYEYTNVPLPPPGKLTGSQLVCLDIGGPNENCLDYQTNGPGPFLASVVTLEAVDAGPDGFVESSIFVAEPVTDLLMFESDLITQVPVTNGTPEGLIANITPEPSALVMLAVGGLAVIRRRRA